MSTEVTVDNVIDEMRQVVRMYAYDRGHSGGIEEVKAIEDELMGDFEPLFEKLVIIAIDCKNGE